jgi:hypothetical protein
MANQTERQRNKAESATTQKGNAPMHEGGDQSRKAQSWGGGSKGSKGPVTSSDKRNPNSSAKT